MKAAGFERWLLIQSAAKQINGHCILLRENTRHDYVERQRQEFDSFYHRFEQKCAALHLIIVQLKWRFKNFCVLSYPGLVDCSINSDSSGGDRQTVPEATKLLKLVHTVPATTSFARIHRFYIHKKYLASLRLVISDCSHRRTRCVVSPG